MSAADPEPLRPIVERHLSSDFFFVNIGANDGVENDPIYPFLAEFGWRGVAVEPDPIVFERLKANYRNFPCVSFERAAIVSHPTALYRIGKGPFEHADWMTQVSATSEERVRSVVAALRKLEWLGPIPLAVDDCIERIDVPCMTFQELAARHSIERIDYLNIDVEGGDLDVLAQIDLDRFENRLLCIEMDPATDSRAAAVDGELKRLGYRAHPALMLFSILYSRP